MLSLRTQYKQDRPIFLHTEQQTLRYAKDETVVLTGKPGDKCGFIATYTGTISSKGLEYECKAHSESVCNALVASSAEIEIKGGALVIAPPQLAAQRSFMKKTEEERLELLLRDLKKKASKAELKQDRLRKRQLIRYGLFAATAVTAGLGLLFKMAHKNELSKSEVSPTLKL